MQRAALTSLAQLDPALLEGSTSVGASAAYTFRWVTLPIIRRGIAVGGFLAFMASFDNIPVSLFQSDPRTEVLPIHLWQIIETDRDVRAAAASGVLIVFTLVVMLIADRLAGLTRQLP
jgi:putative spermidine/putrescine transport system permease protein